MLVLMFIETSHPSVPLDHVTTFQKNTAVHWTYCLLIFGLPQQSNQQQRKGLGWGEGGLLPLLQRQNQWGVFPCEKRGQQGSLLSQQQASNIADSGNSLQYQKRVQLACVGTARRWMCFLSQAKITPSSDKNKTYSVQYVPRVTGPHKVCCVSMTSILLLDMLLCWLLT